MDDESAGVCPDLRRGRDAFDAGKSLRVKVGEFHVFREEIRRIQVRDVTALRPTAEVAYVEVSARVGACSKPI